MQRIVLAGLRKLTSSSQFLRSMQDSSATDGAGAFPSWLLQILSHDEREGLLRMSILPLAITMEMATFVLPSTCKFTSPAAAAAAVAAIALVAAVGGGLTQTLPKSLLLAFTGRHYC